MRANWSGAEAEQNVPTIFVLDGTRVAQFKYHSQNTVDRPGLLGKSDRAAGSERLNNASAEQTSRVAGVGTGGRLRGRGPPSQPTAFA
jgi:hypothetical protein